MTRLKWIVTAPLLAFVALGSWALASPVASSPDDDYHLISAWCSSGDVDNCLPGDRPSTRIVPGPLLAANCYATRPDDSASCQGAMFDSPAVPDTLTDRGNFQHAYPPVYYATMGLLASPDVTASAISMRLFNVALFIALTSITFALLPVRRRATLVWGWFITLVPLGMFLIASNNPSGWAITGVGTAWIALVGYFETTGRRRIGLGAVFALATLMAAGSRGDTAFYVAIAIGAVLLLNFSKSKAFWLASALPVAAIVMAMLFFVTSRQIGAGIDGFSDVGEASVDASSASSLLAFNILNLPYLWTGVFGGWGLGWLDTGLPAIVLWAAAGTFVAVGFAGLSRLDWRKAIAIGGVGAVLVALPLYVLGAGGDPVGANVQPRYLLPLIVLLGGLLMLEPAGKRIELSRVQVITAGAALIIANLVSLETNIRRYVTGEDVAGLNLNSGAEWWWSSSPPPMAVWMIGSAAFAGLVVVLLREVAIVRTSLNASPVSGS